MNVSQKIRPCLWFNNNAEAAVSFYSSLFDGSRADRILRYTDEGREITGMEPGSVLTIDFQLAGFRFIALNGGPHFRFTPAISFFVICESAKEVDLLWQTLSTGGSALMELGTYDWSEKYGWVQDKFGLTWQVSLGNVSDVGQKITPSLLFVGTQQGRAEEALKLYSKIFQPSKVDGIQRFAAGEAEPEGTVKHAQFGLNGEKFMVMDSSLGHSFGFNEAISFQVSCETQKEIDHYWEQLTSNGGEEGQCGWLKDRFGVSWQVTPRVLPELLADTDADKVKRVTRAFLQMRKFNIEGLKRAYAGQAS